MRSLLEVHGRQRVPNDGPVLFVANHANRIFDAVLMRMAVPRRAKFVTHTDILSSPFLAPFIPRNMIIPIEDSLKALQESVEQCRIALQEGFDVVIFPEGRAMGNGFGQYRTGAAYVAAHAQCPMIPVRIQRTSVFRHRVVFGDALDPPAGRDRVTLKAHTAILKQHILAL